MALKQTIIRLRKANEADFIEKNTALADGEVAIVETPFDGIRLKIGQGEGSTFNSLPYETFGLVLKGKVANNDTMFIRSDNVTGVGKTATGYTVPGPTEFLLFVDTTSGKIYYWNVDQDKYVSVTGSSVDIPVATESVAGIMKLYDTLDGTNTDGTVTQRAINVGFRKVQTAANNVVANMNTVDNEMLQIDLNTLKTLNVIG